MEFYSESVRKKANIQQMISEKNCDLLILIIDQICLLTSTFFTLQKLDYVFDPWTKICDILSYWLIKNTQT